jgi:hypothetical protein
MFSTNGRLKNVYIAKLQLCAMQWMLVTNGECFSIDWIIYHVFKPWNTFTQSTPKQTKVSQIPIKQSSKVVKIFYQHNKEVIKPTSFSDPLLIQE